MGIPVGHKLLSIMPNEKYLIEEILTNVDCIVSSDSVLFGKNLPHKSLINVAKYTTCKLTIYIGYTQKSLITIFAEFNSFKRTPNMSSIVFADSAG